MYSSAIKVLTDIFLIRLKMALYRKNHQYMILHEFPLSPVAFGEQLSKFVCGVFYQLFSNVVTVRSSGGAEQCRTVEKQNSTESYRQPQDPQIESLQILGKIESYPPNPEKQFTCRSNYVCSKTYSGLQTNVSMTKTVS